MKEDKIDKILGSKLKKFEESPPSADLFARIEKSLAEKGFDGNNARQAGEMTPKRGGGETIQTPRKRPYIRAGKYIAVAAVIVCAMVVGGIYLLSDRQVDSVLNPNVAQNSGEKQAVTDSNNIINDNTFAERDELSTDVFGASAAQSKSDISTTPRRVVTLANEEDNKAVNGNASGIGLTIISAPPYNNIGTSSKESANGTISSVSEVEDIEQTRQLWADFLTESGKKSGSKKQASGATLYAGNIGQGNSNTTDMREIAASNMVVKERSFVSTEAQKTPALNYADYEGSLTHKMPVTFGVGFSYFLNDRVALNSGITYTFMRSDADLSQNNNYSIEQRLHYVGIPLGASYSIVKKGRWDVYLRGGVMFEKVVSSKIRCTTYTDSGSSTVSSSLNVKGVQFSVNGAAGVMYRLTNFMGLYVEPGATYYFENKKQPASYRTAHPTNFTIQAGVRFSINGR